MRVAIITIVSRNFGNRLQNYALQTVLMRYCDDVLTFRREFSSKKRIKTCAKSIAQAVLQTKGQKFKEFNNKIHFSKTVVTRDDYPRGIESLYDYFIVGSDQVWNPYYDFVAGECDFLEFARNNQKISYAASFGVDKIPSERSGVYARYLKNFKAISVREQQGVDIVNELTGRDAVLVLDPTLLLNEKEWRQVEKRSAYKPKNKYVFVYSLGVKNDRFQKEINQLSKDYTIFDVQQKNGRELPVGPAEFLYLLRNAEIILTDSFHATVFAITFHKRFITFNRSGLNMNSRIESMASLLDKTKHINQYGDFNCESGIDYVSVDKILRKERQKSMEFLKKALGIES